MNATTLVRVSAGLLIVLLAVLLIFVLPPFSRTATFWSIGLLIDLIIVVPFGSAVVLAAGRTRARAPLSALFLAVAMAVQGMYAFFLGGQGPSCLDPAQDLEFAALFGLVIPLQRPIWLLVLLPSPVLAYGLLWRLRPLLRALMVATFLVVFGAAIAVPLDRFAPSEHRCVDF
jgi:hypothetical protein